MDAENVTNATQKKRLKRADIIAALTACGGGIYAAARQLGCAPKTIYRKMEHDEKLREIVDDARGELVDIAENGLRTRILEGDTTAMIWVTKTLGKKRGYVERQEVTGADGGNLHIKIEYVNDWRAALNTSHEQP